MAAELEGTLGIRGLPLPDKFERRTSDNAIPYVINMPLRYEVTEFFQTMQKTRDSAMRDMMQKQWTLFILGLDRFQKLTVEKRESYFQVAGIHGSPQTPWDGADPPPRDPPLPTPEDPRWGNNPEGGYCHHNTVAFPTWHRPYMLLFEQCIWNNMTDIIDCWVHDNTITVEDSKSWKDAAGRWRLFYWDWARKQEYPKGDEEWNDFGLPYVFASERIKVYLPKKGETEVESPLWTFKNPEKDPDTGKPLAFNKMPKGKEQYNIKDGRISKEGQVAQPWGQCSAISRWGILYDARKDAFTGLDGNNNWKSVNMALATAGDRFYKPKHNVPEGSVSTSGEEIGVPGKDGDKPKPSPIVYDIADAVNRMFSTEYTHNWPAFASTKWYAEGAFTKGFMSLEYIHNNIHNITGGSSLGPGVNGSLDDPQAIYGSGQMSDVPVAAFDPIFWMHHCNIDRLCAMWQCLNWDKWFEQEPDSPLGAKYVNVPDVKPDDPLEPFHRFDGGNAKDPENHWTSTLARDWTTLNYQYDDLMPKEGAVDKYGHVKAEQYKSDLLQYINRIYPSTGKQAHKVILDSSIPNDDFFGPTLVAQPTVKAFQDYLIQVRYDRYALRGGLSHSIEFYLAGEYIGQVYVFGGASVGTEVGCANCATQRQARVFSRGQVPLTIPLIHKAVAKEIGSITEKEVEEYLAKNLEVKYFQAGGGELPADGFPDTKIVVVAGLGMFDPVQDADGNQVYFGEKQKPAYRPPYYAGQTYKILPKATENLPGGWGAQVEEGNEARWGAALKVGTELNLGDLVERLPSKAPTP